VQTPPRRRRGPAPSLAPADIASVAIGIADRHGLDAVTMRAVAGGLGTSATALYRYVRSRDELVAQMVDLATAAVQHPQPSGDWVADLTMVAHSLREVFSAHPWLPAAVASPAIAGPHVLDHLDRCLGLLEPVDATGTAKMEAIALLTGVASLFAATRANPDPDAFRHLEATRHPRMAALITQSAPTSPSTDLFDRVVVGILHGVLR